MKPRPKGQVRKKSLAQSKKKLAKTKRVSAKQTSISQSEKAFAKTIWPGIKGSTRFVKLAEFQESVTYSLPSGQEFTVTLKWFTVSHGPRIFGHYDDQNDVCYIGKFIEG